jgi:hypothetical protein
VRSGRVTLGWRWWCGRIAACVVVGALLNVLIAWGLVIWSPAISSTTLVPVSPAEAESLGPGARSLMKWEDDGIGLSARYSRWFSPINPEKLAEQKELEESLRARMQQLGEKLNVKSEDRNAVRTEIIEVAKQLGQLSGPFSEMLHQRSLLTAGFPWASLQSELTGRTDLSAWAGGPLRADSGHNTGWRVQSELMEFLGATESGLSQELLGYPYRELPVDVLWLGMMKGTALYATIPALAWIVRPLGARFGRARNECCLGCGYSIRGLACCPECGVPSSVVVSRLPGPTAESRVQ